MFTTSGKERKGFADMGAPRKPYCNRMPPMSESPADWEAMFTFIKTRGIDPQVAKLNAWYPSWAAGDSWLRVVIPGTSRDQANQFWQARLIEPTQQSGSEPKRYQSPHAARGDALIVVHPRHEFAEPPAGTVLVEGPFDALAASELGFVGVALMGNTPNDDVLDHAVAWLKAMPPAMMVVDGDAVVQGANLVWRLLIHHSLNSLTTLAPYPYKDLAEMPKAERARLLREGGSKR